MITNDTERYEVGITVRMPPSVDVTDYRFLVSTIDKKEAIKEALVQLKAAVVSEKRAKPLLPNIFPKEYEFKINMPTSKKIGSNARLEIKISDRSLDKAVDNIIKHELDLTNMMNTEASFDSLINHLTGIDDASWSLIKNKK